MDKKTEKQVIKSLQKLISIDSVESEPASAMPFGRGVHDALGFYLDLAAGMGFETKSYDGYAGEVILPGNGKGGKKDGVAVLVHLDVVPAGGGWTVPPFSGTVKNGKIFGRGATDDKGAAVVCLYVMKKLLDEGVKLSKDIVLIAGCDEESGQLCMKYYKENAVMPDLGFSPDADFPVINCEKTILQLKLTLAADSGFLGLVDATDSGTRPNIVPEYASATLKNGEKLSFAGRAAHSMVSFEGDNAIHKLVTELRKRAGQGGSAALDFMAERLCDTDGAGLDIKSRDDKSGSLTLNFASLKLLKNKTLEIVIDLRCPLSQSLENITGAIKGKMPQGGRIEILYNQPGLYVSPDDPLVKTLLSAYEKITGEKGGCIISGGGTYARQLKTGVAFGPSEPNAENNIHSADEFVEIARLGTMFDIYYEAIKKLAQ